MPTPFDYLRYDRGQVPVPYGIGVRRVTPTIDQSGVVVSSLTLDFANNIYLRNGVLYPDLPTLLVAGGGSFSRASAGYDLLGSTSFTTDAPRITAVGLLLEGAATNLTPQSKLASGWLTGQATLTASADAAPDGTITAGRSVEDATAGTTHGLFRSVSTSVAAVRYNYSMYAKRNVGTRDLCIKMQNSSFGSTVAVPISLATGAVGTPSATTLYSSAVGIAYAAANGFYRGCLSFLVGSTDTTFNYAPLASSGASTLADSLYNGDSTSAVDFWGIQMELAAAAGYFLNNASSMIATGAGSATRAADLFSINVPGGKTAATITFSDNSTKVVSGLTGGVSWDVAAAVAAHVAANVIAPVLKSITFA